MAPLNLWTIQEKNGTDALLYTAVWKLSCINDIYNHAGLVNLLLGTWKYVLTDRLLMEVSFPIHCEIGFTTDWAHKPCNAKCYHIKGCRKSKLNPSVLVATSASEWYCLCCLIITLKKCFIISLSFTITALIKLSRIVIASWYIWKLPLQDAWYTYCSQIQNSTVFFVYVHEKISEKHGKNNNVETAESGL